MKLFRTVNQDTDFQTFFGVDSRTPSERLLNHPVNSLRDIKVPTLSCVNYCNCNKCIDWSYLQGCWHFRTVQLEWFVCLLWLFCGKIKMCKYKFAVEQWTSAINIHDITSTVHHTGAPFYHFLTLLANFIGVQELGRSMSYLYVTVYADKPLELSQYLKWMIDNSMI